MTRELDPAERYYWMFGLLSPMSMVAYAELERGIDHDVLAAALAAVQARHPLLNLRVDATDGDLSFVPSDGPVPFETREIDPELWWSVIEAELDRRLGDDGTAPCARCVYVTSPGVDRSVVILSIHHAVADGRSGLSVLQEVLRVVEAGPDTLPPRYDLPPGLHERYPAELRSAGAVVETLRAMRVEREGIGPGAGFAFAPTTPDSRRSRITRVLLDGDEVAALRQDEGDELVLHLATPTDLRTRCAAPVPIDEVVLAIGLVSSPYPVPTDGRTALAIRISDQLKREVERGDSHLFYRLARAGSLRADDAGTAAFQEWLATVPHNVAVSNVGLVDAAADPTWLTRLAVLLGASPNQLAFVVISTYRDQMSLHVVTDEAKLDPGCSDRLVAGIVERLALGRPG
jgi:hypothetical protein